MSRQDFQFATLARYAGKAIILGTIVGDGVRWARWASSDSWFKVSAEEVSEF